MHDTLFLLDVIYILAAAVVSVFIFKRLKLASILGYLIAGVVVGPYSLGLVSEVSAVSSIAEFGVVFLLFTIGLELPLEGLKVLSPGHCQTKILGIFQSPNDCRKSQVFCAVHGQHRITFST